MVEERVNMYISRFNIRSFFVVFVMALSLGMSGQSNPDIKTLLSKSGYSKYQKAERLIAKGNSFVGSADSENNDVALSKQARRESNMKKEQAYLLLKDGYNIKLHVLSRYFEDYKSMKSDLSDSNKGKVSVIQTAINEAKAKSKKLYAQSNKTSRLSKSVQMQEDAQKIQLEAIIAAEEGLQLVQSFEQAPVENSVAISKDTLAKEVVESKPVVEQAAVEPEVVAVAALPVAAAAVVKEEEEEKEVEVIEAKPVESNVYFTIQVLADKKPATTTQQKMVYKGSRKVIENVGSGWYRYSVGRFLSYTEAASTMKSEGIKGYVVAYRGSERITTQEAKRILGGVK